MPTQITSYQQVLDLMVAHMAPAASSSEQQIVRRALQGEYVVPGYKAAADGAAGDTALIPILPLDVDFQFTAVEIVPQANLTAHDTNYATVSLEANDGAGGAFTVIASQTTQITGGSGNWTAANRVALTLTATTANRIVRGNAARKQLWLRVAKAAAGVAVPALAIYPTGRFTF